MTLIRPGDIETISDTLTQTLSDLTDRVWGVRIHDAINRDTDQANNADGISRFIVFSSLEYENTTSYTPLAKLVWRVLCDGPAANDTQLAALREELVAITTAFSVRGGPLHTQGMDDLCCVHAAFLGGAEGGLSEDDAAAGYFTSGAELEFEW